MQLIFSLEHIICMLRRFRVNGSQTLTGLCTVTCRVYAWLLDGFCISWLDARSAVQTPFSCFHDHAVRIYIGFEVLTAAGIKPNIVSEHTFRVPTQLSCYIDLSLVYFIALLMLIKYWEVWDSFRLPLLPLFSVQIFSTPLYSHTLYPSSSLSVRDKVSHLYTAAVHNIIVLCV
jgi:hypothetical protein